MQEHIIGVILRNDGYSYENLPEVADFVKENYGTKKNIRKS